jgi:hypothetical protein
VSHSICDNKSHDSHSQTLLDLQPSGGARGYSAITGGASWGIGYYVNDLLIPVVAVERGKTYTFKVYSGGDSVNESQYHPFYITSSPVGGETCKRAAIM